MIAIIAGVAAASSSIRDHRRRRSSAATTSAPPSPAYDHDDPPVYEDDFPPPSYDDTVTPRSTVLTRSLGYGATVAFDRLYTSSTDSDLVFVTVRLRDDTLPEVPEEADVSPERSSPRKFLTRLHTRFSSSGSTGPLRYKALKMPRGEFKRYFARDAQGNYIGTEPERVWDAAELLREYGEYQHLPLGRIQC